MKRSLLFFFLSCFIWIKLYGQKQVDSLKEFLLHEPLNHWGLEQGALLKELYKHQHYSFVWLNQETSYTHLLLQLLAATAEHSYDSVAYYKHLSHRLQTLLFSVKTVRDSILTDLSFSDAALRLLYDRISTQPGFLLNYDGLHYKSYCIDIPLLLIRGLKQRTISQGFIQQEPKAEAFTALKGLWLQLKDRLGEIDFQEPYIISQKVDSGNTPLQRKLYYLGLLPSGEKKFSPKAIKQALTKAQQLLNLQSDGELHNTTLAALNIPLGRRSQELELAMKHWEWLDCCLQQPGIMLVVNIPSATLMVFQNGKEVLFSRLIEGKKSTPTPTLSSAINEVILYPYWNVPKVIAVNELLPKIKRNTKYLEQRNYQVLDKNGIVLDPYEIKWQLLGSSNFPYTIRQSTGCDNSLGIIKFNFNNPFSVYLHDTPTKELFALINRYFSHCFMRVEKAVEIGRLLLRENREAFDSIVKKGCLKMHHALIFTLSQKIPVFVLYSTAWINANGAPCFYKDVYNKNLF